MSIHLARPYSFRTLSLTGPALALSLMLSGCGGGGDDRSPDAQVAPSSTQAVDVTAITASQSGASDLVQQVNQEVANVASASQGGGLAGSTPTSAPSRVKAQSVTIAGTTTVSDEVTYDCATLYAGMGGSGTYTIKYTSDYATGVYDSSVTYSNCSFSYNGLTTVINGSGAYSTRYTDFGTSTATGTSTWVYDYTYVYSGTFSGSYSYKGNQTCTWSSGGSWSCSTNVGTSNVWGTSSVAVSGSRTSVGAAKVRTHTDNEAYSLTISYSNWTYDSVTGLASGKTSVTDSKGNSATIEGSIVNNTATYTVTTVVSGVTSVYTVTVKGK